MDIEMEWPEGGNGGAQAQEVGGLDFSRSLSDEQWLMELSSLSLPSRLSRAEPRVQWELHPHFNPVYANRYRSGSLLSCFIPFANGYTASLKFGFETLPSVSEHLGVACLWGDRARRVLAEVFDLSSGAVLARPPSAGSAAREMVCESQSAKIALLALRQVEALPDALSPTLRSFWLALERDDQASALQLWETLAPDQRQSLSPWGTSAAEQAIASRSERCARWLLSLEPQSRPGWPRLGDLARAALKETLSDEDSGHAGARGLLWLLEAGAPLSEQALLSEFEDAPAAAQPKALRALQEAKALEERQALSQAALAGEAQQPLRGAL